MAKITRKKKLKIIRRELQKINPKIEVTLTKESLHVRVGILGIAYPPVLSYHTLIMLRGMCELWFSKKI